jgi:hypothetical protein
MPNTFIRQEVFCTLQLPGIHNWTDCPLDEVSYLRSPHRHVFHFKCHKIVTHDDRDCEFIMLKGRITKWLNKQYWDKKPRALVFGSMSCEMIAQVLIDKFDLCQCEVSEDNENGAILRVLTYNSGFSGAFPL